jgi:hypothetical protein
VPGRHHISVTLLAGYYGVEAGPLLDREAHYVDRFPEAHERVMDRIEGKKVFVPSAGTNKDLYTIDLLVKCVNFVVKNKPVLRAILLGLEESSTGVDSAAKIVVMDQLKSGSPSSLETIPGTFRSH